jgi:hypothetical protein
MPSAVLRGVFFCRLSKPPEHVMGVLQRLAIVLRHKRNAIFMTTKPNCFYFLVSLSVIAISCRKTPVIQPSPVTALNALAKIERTGGDYDSLYYNNDLQVTRIKMHTGTVNPYDLNYTFEYDANKKLTRINVAGEHYDYVYINGVLAGVNHFIGNTKTDYRIYDFTNGKLTGYEEYYQIGNSGAYDFVSEAELDYHADGNLKSEVVYSFHPQTRARFKHFSFTYTDYDTKFNASAASGRLVFFSQIQLQKNNPGKMTSRDEVNGIETQYSFAYTYNDLSNPLTQLMTGSGAAVAVKYHYY